MGTGTKYPDFEYTAAELSAYTVSIDVFIISLKNQQLIHFTPKDADAFEKWLVKHHIRDIRKNKGTNT